jgi:hypothetical protein
VGVGQSSPFYPLHPLPWIFAARRRTTKIQGKEYKRESVKVLFKMNLKLFFNYSKKILKSIGLLNSKKFGSQYSGRKGFN